MPVLGITGGIASGKSTFCKLLFSRIGGELFESDACARELLETSLTVREQITDRVHPHAYDNAGVPNRKLLRDIIYRDAVRKRALESILHPLIRSRWLQLASGAANPPRLLLVDIPLLFETDATRYFDVIISVCCSPIIQQARLARRDPDLDSALIGRMIASQIDMTEKAARSQHVIWNDGTIDALASQADTLGAYLNERYS